MIEIFGKTEKGPIRDINEDSFTYSELIGGKYMIIVCDGMGGENGGEIASNLAVTGISENIKKNMRIDMGSNSIKHMIISSIMMSNSLINLQGENDQYLRGMGTTAIVCIISDGIAHIGHVGDSRLYLLYENVISQVTKDHTMVQTYFEQGKITEEELENHPKKNMITRALGPENNVDVDYYELPLEPKNKILICTDGLSGYVNKLDIKLHLLNENKKEAIKTLINSAVENGSDDNVTAVIIEAK